MYFKINIQQLDFFNIDYYNIKGVVDCFFSRLDCIYEVQSNMS